LSSSDGGGQRSLALSSIIFIFIRVLVLVLVPGFLGLLLAWSEIGFDLMDTVFIMLFIYILILLRS
jgi:hypothetical protein